MSRRTREVKPKLDRRHLADVISLREKMAENSRKTLKGRKVLPRVDSKKASQVYDQSHDLGGPDDAA